MRTHRSDDLFGRKIPPSFANLKIERVGNLAYWTLLPAKAMVLYGLDAHSIKEIEKGYVDVENMWNEVDESP